MQTQIKKRFYTPEEYLALEEAAEFKSEYIDGEIVPVTAGTTNHNQITGNVYANLKFFLKGQNYRLFINHVRLWIPRYNIYTYPDIMVISGKPMYESNSTTTVTNPSIIIEVLSNSTRSYGKSDKFRTYRSITEFKEYILIDQYRFYIEQFAKN